MIIRGALTLIFCTIYGWFNYIAELTGRLEAGKSAGMQFQSSDQAYILGTLQTNFWESFGISSLFFMIILFLIWFKPIKNLCVSLANGDI